MNIKKVFSNLFPYKFRLFFYSTFLVYTKNTTRRNFGKSGPHTDLYGPLNLDPKQVFLDDYTRLQPGIRIIGINGTVRVKKFSAIGAETLIIPGNHIPTVGMPQYLSTAHLNDVHSEIVVEEDCWVGARCILLSHCHIGRGAVVAAGSTVTKPIPPYAVVAGSPARVVAARFSLSQILAHERSLYPETERMSEGELTQLFAEYYEGKRTLGIAPENEDFLRLLKSVKKEKQIEEYE